MASSFKRIFLSVITGIVTSFVILRYHLNSRLAHGYFLLFESAVMFLGIFIMVDALLNISNEKDKIIRKNLTRVLRITIGLGIIITHVIVNLLGGYAC